MPPSFSAERLNAGPGFFASLVPTVVEMLGDAFPEVSCRRSLSVSICGGVLARKLILKNAPPPPAILQIKKDPEHVMEVLNDEETQFRRTLNRGRRLFAQAADKATDGVLDGATVWRLWDTYGFPNDLTRR